MAKQSPVKGSIIYFWMKSPIKGLETPALNVKYNWGFTSWILCELRIKGKTAINFFLLLLLIFFHNTEYSRDTREREVAIFVPHFYVFYEHVDIYFDLTL